MSTALARRVTVLPPSQGLRARRRAEQAPECVTLAELERTFLTWLERSHTANTHRTYRDSLRRWQAFLAVEGFDPQVETTEALDFQVVDAFVDWLRQYRREYRRGSVTSLSDMTVQTHMNAVLAMFRYGCRRRLVDTRFIYADMRANAWETLGKPTRHAVNVDRRIPLLVAAADRLELPTTDAPWSEPKRLTILRDRALLHLLIVSGIRRAEAVSLNREDVADGHVAEALVTGKGGKTRVIFYDAATQDAIRAYLDARADTYRPLFLRHDNHRGAPGVNGEGWRIGHQAVWLAVKHHGATAGVPASTHQLRHSMATTLLNRGADLSVIQDLLGHASPNVTKQVYAHYDRSTLRRAFREFSPSTADQVAELEAASTWAEQD